ncbi:MAG: alpha/beta hydrolase [Caldilineaceae bacterium]|nr:alpha/beta hydrolase [Caldilineaceae bacterium]
MAEFATTNGTIYYEVIDAETAGAQPPTTLTLLHNIMSTGRTAWGRMVEPLAKRYRLLLPDLPGHGRSQGYPAGFDYTIMTEQVAALMAQEGATQGHLLGCSAGGMIAQQLVQQGWADPLSLTLISTTYSTAPAVTAGAQALKPENFQFGKRWMEATAKLHDEHHYPGYYEERIVAAYREMTPATTIDLPLSALAAWSMPVCIIHGTEDEFFPVTVAEQMANTIPNAELHMVPDQSHALIFRQWWKVLAIIEEFLW